MDARAGGLDLIHFGLVEVDREDERGEAGAEAGEPVGFAGGRQAAAQGAPLQRPRRGCRPGDLTRHYPPLGPSLISGNC